VYNKYRRNKMIEKFKPNSHQIADIEYLFRKVTEYNQESDSFYASMTVDKYGVCIFVTGDNIKDQFIREMVNRDKFTQMSIELEYLYMLEHKDEIDPKIEAQNDLDKEQF
jgi:hypothetical protein